jgi:hypothetical protein
MNDHLQRTWELFKADNAIVEVRALDCSGKSKVWQGWARGTVSGYFDNRDAFVNAVMQLDQERKASGVYVTLNPVQPDLLARAVNRLIAISKHGTTTEDVHIVARRWLLLDFDPIRPTGISSTKEELKAALDAASRAQEHLSLQGWQQPVSACSGNGIHLLYRIDLPNDNDTREMLRSLLKGLSASLSDEAVDVDTSVFNAARIVKLYGTAARKGDSTPERPHRRSQFLE